MDCHWNARLAERSRQRGDLVLMCMYAAGRNQPTEVHCAAGGFKPRHGFGQCGVYGKATVANCRVDTWHVLHDHTPGA